MRLVATPDGVINSNDRAIWLTRPFNKILFTSDPDSGVITFPHDINFTTLGNSVTIDHLTDIEIFPYNYVGPFTYARTNYVLMEDVRQTYSNGALIRIIFNPTNEQKLILIRYFSYWRTNALTITIGSDIWIGYLTTNNKDIYNHQFNPEINSAINLELECIKGR